MKEVLYPEKFISICTGQFLAKTGIEIPVVYALGKSGKVYTFIFQEKAWKEYGLQYEENL